MDFRDGEYLLSCSILDRISIVSNLFNNFAISSIVFLLVEPACSDRTVIDIDFNKILMILDAACTRKSANFTNRNEMECEKNSTMSEFTTDLVWRM